MMMRAYSLHPLHMKRSIQHSMRYRQGFSRRTCVGAASTRGHALAPRLRPAGRRTIIDLSRVRCGRANSRRNSVHEKLDSSGVQVSPCYFDLSKSDRLQMDEFAAGETRELIQLAVGASAARKRDFASAGRL